MADGILARKVVVVTGAGRGIGREIALLSAREGAKVVVNDLGGSAEGEGGGAEGPAQEVVEAIRDAGGEAVPNFDSVAEPAAAANIVKTALDAFGRIDCVVNNAGILRDRIFHRMSVVDFELVIKVHLLGSFYVSRAAATHFREQESGSFVHFTSTSGLIGNFAKRIMPRRRWALSACQNRSRSTCSASTSARIACRPSPGAGSSAPFRTRRPRKRRASSASRRWDRKRSRRSSRIASDLAKDVTGQIFAVRMNEIFLMGQSRPVRSVHSAEGWTPQTIAERAMPAMKSSFYPLDRSGDIFCWDPL
jgi:NAD(P)-dependent dehydrogenase (short-subunit alcohol dehydrogenase family)